MRITPADVFPVLKDSRHAIHLTGGLQEPAAPLHSYVFLTTYKRQCERMQRFTFEANVCRDRLDRIVEGLRPPCAMSSFRALLKAEGFATMPGTLAVQIQREEPTARAGGEKPNHAAASKQSIGGICVEALDLLQDCVLPPKLLGLMRKVVPSRQFEIAKLMIALERVKLNFARVLITLTPRSQLTDPMSERQEFAGVTAGQLADMESEFADVTRQFLTSGEHQGLWSLEYVAARGYLTRLMDNVRVVRYLAQNFPEALSEFQKVTEPK